MKHHSGKVHVPRHIAAIRAAMSDCNKPAGVSFAEMMGQLKGGEV